MVSITLKIRMLLLVYKFVRMLNWTAGQEYVRMALICWEDCFACICVLGVKGGFRSYLTCRRPGKMFISFSGWMSASQGGACCLMDTFISSIKV